MSNVGCQPLWFYKPEINLTLCSNFSQLHTFVHNYTQILSLNPEEINKNLGCLKPCTYMEYKVLKMERLKIWKWLLFCSLGGQENTCTITTCSNKDIGFNIVWKWQYWDWEGSWSFFLCFVGSRCWRCSGTISWFQHFDDLGFYFWCCEEDEYDLLY